MKNSEIFTMAAEIIKDSIRSSYVCHVLEDLHAKHLKTHVMGLLDDENSLDEWLKKNGYVASSPSLVRTPDGRPVAKVDLTTGEQMTWSRYQEKMRATRIAWCQHLSKQFAARGE